MCCCFMLRWSKIGQSCLFEHGRRDVGKGVRGGIIVGVAVLVAAIVYSTLYFQQGLFRYESDGTSIILVLAWTLVVAVLLVLLWQRMLVREEYLRKFYLSDATLFNFELGAVSRAEALDTQDADGLVSYLRKSLAGLSYEGSPLDPPDGFSPTLCVSTRRFSQGKNGEDWRGSVQRVKQRDDGHRTFVEIATFENAAELTQALKNA